MVEKSTDLYDVPDAKDRGLLLVTVREGSSVMPMFVRRLSEDGKVVIDLEQVVHGGFRKIEPKPREETRDDGGCDVQKANIEGETRSLRLLESKSTRRGVRICPTCQGRVGYRSKVCKHCLLSSGGSNRSSTNVKKKHVRQQRKPKVNYADTKLGTRLVNEDAENVQENEENCHSTAPIDNEGLEISGTKSKGELLYVSPPTSTLKTVSNIDCSRCSNTECPIPINVSGGHDDILYETQTQPEDNEGDESFSNERSIMTEDQKINCLPEVDNCSAELSLNLDSEKFLSCRNKTVSNFSDMMSTQLVHGGTVGEIAERNPEVLYQSVESVEQHSNNNVEKLAGGPKNGANGLKYPTNKSGNLVDNLRNRGNATADLNNSMNSSERDEEELETKEENVPCNGSTGDEEVQNIEDFSVNDSEDQSLSDVVHQRRKSTSPVLNLDVNSIGSVSMSNSDESQSVPKNEYNVGMESATSANTFVFQSADTNSITAVKRGNIHEEPLRIGSETNVGIEKHEDMKRKKTNVCQEQDNRRKKTKISSVQFVRIEPKPFLLLNDDDSDLKKRQGVLKQNRLLSSNPTRRGVMLCPLCQKDVGCRSRTCKYCKVAINLSLTRSPLEEKNLLAVELCQETCPQYTVFSVKKTLNASEERCFVKKVKTDKESVSRNVAVTSDVYYCDCVENNSSSCEHTLSLYRSPKIAQARKTTLKASKIDPLPIDFIYKLKLGELWEKIKENEFPVVQQVCQNTLVILDVDSNVETTPNALSCVHVRFEKIRRRSSTELHIFCSGKTCSVWNEVEDGEKDVPATCIHYCVSLWAIASDNDLQKYFKVFLDAKQVYLHSEVFESVVKE